MFEYLPEIIAEKNCKTTFDGHKKKFCFSQLNGLEIFVPKSMSSNPDVCSCAKKELVNISVRLLET